jgi:hypothetical protein
MELISDLHGNCEKERQAEQQSSSNRAAISRNEEMSVGVFSDGASIHNLTED